MTELERLRGLEERLIKLLEAKAIKCNTKHGHNSVRKAAITEAWIDLQTYVIQQPEDHLAGLKRAMQRTFGPEVGQQTHFRTENGYGVR